MTHELRRHDLQITDPVEIDRILLAARYATIALNDGAQPYIVTLSCGYDATHQRLCFHVARAGRKLDIISSNPLACATVIGDLGYKDGECAHPYESVVLFGRMRLLTDPSEVRSAMRVLIAQLESLDAEAEIWNRNQLDSPEALDRFRMLVLEIDGLTAKTGQ
jgi:nitroimidazol reductase NimA-like FMN-containing flavoprotein (pyridoxamine 5'-phosphate oxidase superfamily)